MEDNLTNTLVKTENSTSMIILTIIVNKLEIMVEEDKEKDMEWEITEILDAVVKELLEEDKEEGMMIEEEVTREKITISNMVEEVEEEEKGILEEEMDLKIKKMKR